MSAPEIAHLSPLVGKWTLEAKFPDGPAGGPGGSTTFEWMPGERFLVQRWEAPDPAPDGIAIIGPNPSGDTFLQHYFDARGVARVYKLALSDGELRLWRDDADFSPLDFAQRYIGEVSVDWNEIRGAWEIAHDKATFEHDFELNYTRVG